MSKQSKLDLAVIGAGIYGIQAARTYLSIHPSHNVVVFEASGSVGGVWSSERVYDDFWTQTPLEIAEFSDMALKDVPTADRYHGFFPAKHVSKYLEEYVRSRKFAASPLESRIRLHLRVTRIVKQVDGWALSVWSDRDGTITETEHFASKVIDATGLTSCPSMPLLPGRELFQGDIFHHLDFGRIQTQLGSNSKWQNVIIIGGAKSAADLAYACAKLGKNVNWIIRRSGAGPAAFVSAKGNGMYKNSNESFYTRFTSHFLASLYMNESNTILGRFLYCTSFGQRVFEYIWNKIDAKAHGLANYDRVDGRENQFYNLKPDSSLFWQNDSTGICQRDDFFDTIARQVKVHRQNISHMTESSVVLEDGREVNSDLILCGTGWKTSHPEIIDCEENRIELQLGLVDTIQPSLEQQKHWQELESAAEIDVFRHFPILKDPPFQVDGKQSIAPLRLYKGILPIGDHSIAFLGQFLLGNNFRVAEVQALFAVAALDDTLELPSKEEMQTDIARHIAWSKCRYLKKGQHGTWLYWDMVPYTDHLLDRLGLKSHRQHGYLADLFTTCFAKDLRGLIDEYKDKYCISNEHEASESIS